MCFDRFLEHYDSDAGQKEEVALIFYCQEEHNNQKDTTSKDIKEIIQSSRSSISTSSTSTYLRRLREEDWITPTENDGYRLTHTGKDEVESLLHEGALDNSRDEGDLFIDTTVVDNERYQTLIVDINNTYQHRTYDGTMVLTRKLLEDLIFQILKTHYAGDDVQMFYDQDNQRHYSFDDLLNNLKEGVPVLRRYSRELDQELVENIRELKDAGNSGAHSVRIDFSDEEVEDWSDSATYLVDVLYDVLLGARIADEHGD